MIIARRWISAADLPPPVWNTLAGLGPGGLQLCQAGPSHFLVRLHAREPQRTNGLAAARATIAVELLRAEQERVWQGYIERVREQLGL
jgi:hypothetical protein